MRACTCVALIAVCTAGTAAAIERTGEIGADLRLFAHDAVDPAQHGNNFSLRAEPEFWQDWADGDQRLTLSLFGRIDQGDDERSHADVRELYWRRSFDAAELFVGLRKVFWGVTESAHLVDIVNQTDGVENLDTEDKLGQPMVNLRLLRDWGTLDFFVLPYFRERTFPGHEGRLRAALRVATERAEYEAAHGRRHIDLAVRWSHFVGDWDIGLAHFAGTGREPRLALRADGGGIALVPRYELIGQTSLDVQATKGSWLWKLEALTRRADAGRHAAAAAGIEYTIVGFAKTDIDLGLVAEYLYDDRGREAPTAFQNDLALGTRLAFNDTQSTELLVLGAQDLRSRSRFISLEGSRRIGRSFRLSLEARVFSNVPPGDLLAAIAKDDYLELGFAWFY